MTRAGNFSFVECDLNKWVARRKYDVVIPNQSLHHITALESVLDQAKACLRDFGLLLAGDLDPKLPEPCGFLVFTSLLSALPVYVLTRFILRGLEKAAARAREAKQEHQQP